MSAAIRTSARTHAAPAKRAPWPLIKCAISHWSADQAGTIGAALAFYCAFSIAPLLVILLTTAGWIVGAEAAYGHLSAQLTALFGKPTADILLEAMRSSQNADGHVATVVSPSFLASMPAASRGWIAAIVRPLPFTTADTDESRAWSTNESGASKPLKALNMCRSVSASL